MLVDLTISWAYLGNSNASILTFLSLLWSPSGLRLSHTGNIFHSQVLAGFPAQQFWIPAAHWDDLWNANPTYGTSRPRVSLGLVTKYKNPNCARDSNKTQLLPNTKDSIKTRWTHACPSQMIVPLKCLFSQSIPFSISKVDSFLAFPNPITGSQTQPHFQAWNLKEASRR